MGPKFSACHLLVCVMCVILAISHFISVDDASYFLQHMCTGSSITHSVVFLIKTRCSQWVLVQNSVLSIVPPPPLGPFQVSRAVTAYALTSGSPPSVRRPDFTARTDRQASVPIARQSARRFPSSAPLTNIWPDGCDAPATILLESGKAHHRHSRLSHVRAAGAAPLGQEARITCLMKVEAGELSASPKIIFCLCKLGIRLDWISL